ncbi:MAG: type III secretion system chaperone [Mailhella sp.]|nr:type III secretion system chaperone [Mailhella sp.]
MDYKAEFLDVLAGLAQALDLPEITAGEDGSSAVVVIDDFEVVLNCLETENLLLFTVVAPLPENGRQELLETLMDANTFYYKTQGFTLAARADTGVTLQGMMPLRMLDRNSMAAYVQNFVNVAEYWQEFCKNAASEGTAEPQPSSEVLPGDILNIFNFRV